MGRMWHSAAAERSTAERKDQGNGQKVHMLPVAQLRRREEPVDQSQENVLTGENESGMSLVL